LNTGLDSFSNPADIGPLYPFPGTEVPLAIIGIALWILFHVLQTREENREWIEADEKFDERRLLPGIDEPAHIAEMNAATAAPSAQTPRAPSTPSSAPPED
jgi:hypothetical protein